MSNPPEDEVGSVLAGGEVEDECTTGGSGVAPQPLEKVVLEQLVQGEQRSSVH